MKKVFYSILVLFALISSNSYAQCDVVDITSITDDFQTSGPVIGNGTASCDELTVILSCAQELPGINAFNSVVKNVSVVNGVWEATFPASEIVAKKCDCGDNMIMVAMCKDEQTCPATVKTFTLCGESCPNVNISVEPITCENRNTDGEYEVDFSINATGGLFTGFYNVNFGDGTNQDYFLTSTNPLTITHDYICPNIDQTYFVTVTGIGCTSETFHTVDDTIPIQFPSCDCPIMSDITAVISDDGCTVNFDIAVSGCLPMDMKYFWSFGDGPPEQSDTSNIEHTYSQNEPYEVSVCVTGFGDDCCIETTVDITNCSSGGTDDENDNDDCFFCFCTDFWCCIIYALFLIALFTLLSSLAYALCQGNTTAWIVFGISLAAVVVLVPVLIWVCDLDFCLLLISIATVGTINWAFVCGTNLILPPTCKSWFCSQHSIGILGIEASGYLIVNIVLWLLALTFCTV